MKVTVTFSTIKIVVPCGEGDLTVRELTQLATTRYKKATGKPRLSWVSVHSLKAREGGILDPDDRLVDVCDDREQLIAFYDEEGVPQGGDGMSASSDESEAPGYSRNDVEVCGDYGGSLQVRRGSEPALNKLDSRSGDSSSGTDDQASTNKRWSAAGLVINRDLPTSRNDLSVIDEASFADTSFDPGGRLSPLPPPFERGQGSGAARDSDRPQFTRDANRLSIQIGHDDGRWFEAAERAAEEKRRGFEPPPPCTRSIEADFEKKEFRWGGSAPLRQVNVECGVEPLRQVNVEMGIESNSAAMRREPLGGSSPPQPSQYSKEDLHRVVIVNEIGPLGIHVVPSGDPAAAGLLIQGIEPGGRIDRDGRLAVADRILEINGSSLTDCPFHKAQEIFKEALFAKELVLVVDKASSKGSSDIPEIITSDLFHSEENKENIGAEAENIGTLSRKVQPGSKVTSVVQAANTRKIGKKMYVSLVKGVHGLGFSITTRDIPAGGVAPIYIKHILPKGAAIENGQLRPGDRLLEVNSENMDGKSQSEVVSLLRNTPQNGTVNLIVSRQERVDEVDMGSVEIKEKEVEPESTSTAPNTEAEEDEYSSPDVSVNPAGDVVFPWKHREILTLDIPVHDTERAGLGVSVKGKTTGGGARGVVDLGIFVKSVIHGGAASRDGRLRTNDQLVNINGMSLLGKANCDAMDTLRRAMHEEGPTPGLITLTVARRLSVAGDSAVKLKGTGRDSVTSMMTSSSGDDSYREYRVSLDPGHKLDRSIESAKNVSGSPDNSVESQNNTVIYVPLENPNRPSFDNFIAPAAPRNPVVDRLMGRKDNRGGAPPVQSTESGRRNESYYRATGHDTWNESMMPGLDSTLKSPTVHQVGRETVMIEQAGEGKGGRQHSPDGAERLSERSSKLSDSDATMTDVAYCSQTSLEDPNLPFARDMPGRQSMSEKRHATLDAKSTDTYQRNKKARQEREKSEKDVGPMLGMKKSSSLESLQTMMAEVQFEGPRTTARQGKTSRVVRGRGCNESFRAAVDRSYEAGEDEQAVGAEVGDFPETFDRHPYRQSGSSLDSNADFKKKKNVKLFKGFGMFKFGKQRAKSSDSGRMSRGDPERDRKTPTPMSERDSAAPTPTAELESRPPRPPSDRRDPEQDAARARLVAEQARIQQHYRRLLQQRQEEQQQQDPSSLAPSGQSEEVYSGEPSPPGLRGEPVAPMPHPAAVGLPVSLATARPGSRSGITGTPTSDPRFNHNQQQPVNYEEIQRHLSRRQAQYHSQRREHRERSDRPVSNFYEYETVQSAINHGRQHSQTSLHSQNQLHPIQQQQPPQQHQQQLPQHQQPPQQHLQQQLPPQQHQQPQPPHSQSGLPGQRYRPDPRETRMDPSPHRNPPVYMRQSRTADNIHVMQQPPPSLSVAPLPSKYNQFAGRSSGYGDYETQDYDDPYSRVAFNNRPGVPQGGRRPSHPGQGQGHPQQEHPQQHKEHIMKNSHSASRIQSHSAVPKNMYIPSLPPGSKV